MECQLTHSVACAVVSRLKLDAVLINKQSAGRYISSADARVTMQWPRHACSADLRLNLRLQPVDLPAFTHFVDSHVHDCQGLLAVGPIIDLDCDEVTFLKPVQLKLPILPSAKKAEGTLRSKEPDANGPQRSNTSQLSQQEIILRQQQSIFKSMLGEGKCDEHRPHRHRLGDVQSRATSDCCCSTRAALKPSGTLTPMLLCSTPRRATRLP